MKARDKATVYLFYIWVSPRNRLQLRNTVTLNFFFVKIYVAVNFIVSQIGPKWSTSKGKGANRPIRDTIKSTIMATGIEKNEKRLKTYS